MNRLKFLGPLFDQQEARQTPPRDAQSARARVSPQRKRPEAGARAARRRLPRQGAATRVRVIDHLVKGQSRRARRANRREPQDHRPRGGPEQEIKAKAIDVLATRREARDPPRSLNRS